jgi:hypothetical protein
MYTTKAAEVYSMLMAESTLWVETAKKAIRRYISDSLAHMKESQGETSFPNVSCPAGGFGHKGWCVPCPGSRQPLLFPDLAFPGDARKTRKKRAYAKPAEPIKRQEQLKMEKLFDRA